MSTPPAVVARIGKLALEHPTHGCNKIEALLALEGRRVSAITVQKILNDQGLGNRHERWLALKRQNADAAIELSPEQAAFLEKLNPCFPREGSLSDPSSRASGPVSSSPRTPSLGDLLIAVRCAARIATFC